MKKWLSLLIIYSSCFVFGLPIQDRKIDSVALLELAAGLGIPSDADLIAETQKHWLRKPGQERWEIAELSPNQKLYVLNWATKQGLFDTWKPLYQVYDKALILGATTSRMQMRLDFLKELWNEGVRFQEIVWLTGDRPLDNRADNLTDRCKNESEAARILWEETELPLEMRSIAVTFIAVPMKQGVTRISCRHGSEGGQDVETAFTAREEANIAQHLADERDAKDGRQIVQIHPVSCEKCGLTRPNTEDTIVAWLQDSPDPCRALFVSDQPFCGYQFAVIKATIPESYEFDLVGRGVDPMSHPSAAAITLDSIARWIYTSRL